MRFLIRFGIPIFGAILATVGLALMQYRQPPSFEWTAYRPHGDVLNAAWFVVTAGTASLVTGFVLIAGWAGYRIGRARG